MRTVEDIACEFPATLDEALKIQADASRRGRPLCGGTDLIVQWESGVVEIPGRVVSVWGVPELQGIREESGNVIVGAAVTHATTAAGLLSMTLSAAEPGLVTWELRFAE